MLRYISIKIKKFIRGWNRGGRCDCGGDIPFFPAYIEEHNMGVYVCKKCKKEWVCP